MLIASIGFIVAFTLIFLRVPIALALGLVGFFGFAFIVDLSAATAMSAMVVRDNLLSYNLVVIPLFVLMGNLIAGTGISDNLFRAAQVVTGKRRGGLSFATILSCGAFGAVCGSSVATAATMGRIAIPAMKKNGYSDELSSATVAAGGTLSVLIPPSVILVIYGVITETNIGQLFAAGIIPGLLGIVGYLLAIKWTLIRKRDSAPSPDDFSNQQKKAVLTAVIPVLGLFALVMGGIYSGWFTVVEASGIGSAGALGFAFVRKSFGWKQFLNVLRDTIDTTAMMYAILLGAAVFSEFINLTDVHHSLLSMIDASNSSPAFILAAIIVIYIVLGCVLESLSILLLTVPLFFPIVTGLGYDPVWFGIVVVVAVEIGLITPPIGVNLFVIQSVTKNISLSVITRGVAPFIVADIGRLIILVLVPSLVMWLPHLLKG